MKKNKRVYSRGEKFSLQNEKKKAVKIEMEQKDEEKKGKKNGATTKLKPIPIVLLHPPCREVPRKPTKTELKPSKAPEYLLI